jgi:hypothetical protein
MLAHYLAGVSLCAAMKDQHGNHTHGYDSVTMMQRPKNDGLQRRKKQRTKWYVKFIVR